MTIIDCWFYYELLLIEAKVKSPNLSSKFDRQRPLQSKFDFLV